MEFTSKEELYCLLKPVFLTKKRLICYKYKLDDFDYNLIWNYLANKKWPYCKMLSLYDIINDILNFDVCLLGGENEEE